MASGWEDIAQDELVRETDVAYEQELKQNPYSLKLWFAYLNSKAESSAPVRFLIYERSVKSLPGSYKLWKAYLKERIAAVKDNCITDPSWEGVNNTYERALVFLHKMPRIWLDYVEFLMAQKKVTLTRRTLDKALRALPITQHGMIWETYIKFIKSGVPQETALCAFRRYLMLEPDHVEVFIAYLRTIGRYDEAAQRLCTIVDDEDFGSMEGKTHHQLWMDLCDLISRHPAEIKSVKIEMVIRGGIQRFTDEVGRLWISLGDHFIRLGQFEKARDVYEEAMASVSTVHDFSLIFDAYSKFLESLITAHMEKDGSPGAGAADIDILMARLEDLMERRPELVSSVKLRQNPHNVHEWLQRTRLYKDNPEKVIRCYTEAVMTVDPSKAEGRLYYLWAAFAKFYEAHGDLENARIIFEKATKVNYRAVDDLASIWSEWSEMELRHKQYDKALQVTRRAVSQPKQADVQVGTVQSKLHKSVKMWSLNVDLEECLGTMATTRAAYDMIIELKVATPRMILNYASYLEEKKYWEDSFKIYERGIKVFKWPHVNDIWIMYLTKFVDRYGGRKLERARDLFEQSVDGCPAKYARRLHLLYAKLEEEHGLARHALSIYNRATKVVEDDQMYEMYSLLTTKTIEFFGQTKTREIYEEQIEKLPQKRIKDACIKYAKMETMLGEVDRARGIYTHASQFCDPNKEEAFWRAWRGFEVQHGNEDTFRDMLRIKRSVQAQFAQIHFNAADIAAEAQEAPMDPMQQAETELQKDEDRKRRISGAAAVIAKRQRLDGDPEIAAKESLGEFIVADKFTGPKPGYVFKSGSRGLGYYEDQSLRVLKARRAAEERSTAAPAGANEEEIDIDLDEDEGGGAAPSNPDEINVTIDDITEGAVPARVLGQLGDFARPQAEQAPPEPEEEDAPVETQTKVGALQRFRMRKGKGKGK